MATDTGKILAGIALLAVAFSAGAAPIEERRFGIVPQLSPIHAAEAWQPFLDHLSAKSDMRLRFATAASVMEFDRRVLAGEYDYVFCNPLLFRELERKLGYRALARSSNPLIGIIVVQSHGPWALAELRDKTIAFPAPTAFGATIVNRADLNRAGINHYVFHLSTHESVYRAVAQGRHIAGGGVTQTFAQLPADLRRQLRILHRTRPVASHVFAARPDLPADERARVARALLTMHQDKHGRAILNQLDIGSAVRVKAGDFAVVDGTPFPVRIREMALHVVPRHSEQATRAYMEPLAAYLAQRLDLKIALRTHKTMAGFEQAIYAERHPALINANPLHVRPLRRQGFTVIAQQLPVNSPEGMRAVLLVREDSAHRNLSDLRGHRIAFAEPHAFFSAIVPRLMLKRAGLAGQYIDASRPGPTSTVLPRLRDGEVEAVGIESLLLNNVALRREYIDGRMRVLAQSEPMPGLPWLLGPRVDSDLVNQIRHLLLNYDAESPGHAAMQAAGIERLLAASDQTYESIELYLAEAGLR